jgi:hypothetical protein
MALREAALLTSAPVIKGALYVANIGPGASFIPVVSSLGVNPDATGGPAKTVADLKTALSATEIRNCDLSTRAGGFPGSGGGVSGFLD